MYYLIYKITNLINNKIYIGAHSTDDITDNYMGSGKFLIKAIKKHGIENFKKEILYVFDNKDEMYKKENEIVNETFIKRKDNYNAKRGGEGGFGVIDVENWKNKISISQKKRYENGAIPWNRGRIVPDEERQHMSERMVGKFVGENNPMYGKPCYYNMSDEEKQKWSDGISKGNTGKIRTDEHKKNYSSAASKRKWLVHKDGTRTHTMDENDYRLSHPDWQNGKIWKDK